MLDLVTGLVEQSLLQVVERQGRARYRLLETIRFYEEEVNAAEAAGYFAAVGRYVPNMLNVIQQAVQSPPPATLLHRWLWCF